MSVIHYSTDELARVLAAAVPVAHWRAQETAAATLASLSRTNAAAWNATYANPGGFFDAPGRPRPEYATSSRARAILRAARARPIMRGTPAFLDALRTARLLAYNCVSNGGSVQPSHRQLARWSHVLANLLSHAANVIEETRGSAVVR